MRLCTGALLLLGMLWLSGMPAVQAVASMPQVNTVGDGITIVSEIGPNAVGQDTIDILRLTFSFSYQLPVTIISEVVRGPSLAAANSFYGPPHIPKNAGQGFLPTDRHWKGSIWQSCFSQSGYAECTINLYWTFAGNGHYFIGYLSAVSSVVQGSRELAVDEAIRAYGPSEVSLRSAVLVASGYPPLKLTKLKSGAA